MNKRRFGRTFISLLLLISILGVGFNINTYEAKSERRLVSTGDVTNQMVVPGGMPIGIYMKTDGVFVLGTEAIEGKSGQKLEPARNLVREGDYILGINGESTESKSDLIKLIKELESQEVVLKLRRDDEEFSIKLDAVLCADDSYKLGIWVRDSVQGLGTVTYITSDQKFGALGHGIHDSDTDELLEISEGRVYETRILRIVKGKKGEPGGMEGMIVYNRYNLRGKITDNTESGVFGTLQDTEEITDDIEAVPVCTKKQVKTGAAVIRCCVEGEVKEYDIEIERLHTFSLDTNKDMVIKVVDEELLKVTGGIVQGMSGSPILQDGKIVGAVTHVFINNPEKGYGIFIENMMKQ